MRKGTHSCVECRQRKVRCVSQPHARKCDGCSTRDLRCTDQELRRSRSPDSGERKSTRDRVRELEGMLNQVLSQQSRINQGFGSRELDSDVAEPFGILPAVERRIPATEGRGAKTKKRSKMNILESTSSDAHVTKTQNFSDEPLRKLFENVDVGEKCDCNLQGSVRGTQAGLPVADKSAHRSLQALLLQVPNSRELMSILGAGQTALGLWSGAFPDKLRATGNGALERLRDHIYTCLHSDSMADAAKVILCLALHIQQLPTDIETLKVSLLAPTYDLQETYMTAAENLLASDEGLAGSLDGLECLLIQSEFYINKGNLRKVWLIIRRAVNLAQLLGLHRKIDADISPKQAVRWKAIWLELWQRDRGFSLILGLPYATLDSQVPQLTSDNDDSDLQKTKWFLRDLGIVMGHIVDRDQDPSGKTYSITLKIEEELEKCQRLLYAICGMFVAKMRFYTVQRLLHLPFLLEAFRDRKYESSRLATLESSRQMINVYNVLRNEKRPVLKMCDMVDFQVFAAAMTLVVDLLACSRPPDYRGMYREERDWQQVLQVAMELGRLSQSMKGCNVAALGARVLEDFSNLRKGSPEEVCKVVIPYFGRVEIRRYDTRKNEQVPYPHPVAQTIDQTELQ